MEYHNFTLIQVNNICHTFDSYFTPFNQSQNTLQGYLILIDEFFMTKNIHLTKLYYIYYQFEQTNIIKAYGDHCQNISIESQNYDYLNSSAVKELFPNLIQLKYNSETNRYDYQTNKFLEYFIQNKKLDKSYTLNPINQNIYKHICLLNKTRIQLNLQTSYQYIKNHNITEKMKLDFEYMSKIEPYNIHIGAPLLFTKNLPKYEIYNNMTFTIINLNFTNNQIQLNNNNWYSKYFIEKNSIINWATTCYKIQGSTIHENYGIQ